MYRLLEQLRLWLPKPPPPALTEAEAEANLRLSDRERVELAHVENVVAMKPPFE